MVKSKDFGDGRLSWRLSQKSLKYKYKHHKNEGVEHLTQKTKVV